LTGDRKIGKKRKKEKEEKREKKKFGMGIPCRVLVRFK
jgi:hypothetical protein